MHFVPQVLMVSISWGAGIKTSDSDQKVDEILKAYAKLKDSLQQAQHSNAITALNKLESGLRELDTSLKDIPLNQTGPGVADDAQDLLRKLDAMHETGRKDTWRSRIELYASIADLFNPST